MKKRKIEEIALQTIAMFAGLEFGLSEQVMLKVRNHKKYMGFYTYDHAHKIEIFTKHNKTELDVVESTVHELVHAWQVEHCNGKVNHGKFFKTWVKYFKRRYNLRIN